MLIHPIIIIIIIIIIISIFVTLNALAICSKGVGFFLNATGADTSNLEDTSMQQQAQNSLLFIMC